MKQTFAHFLILLSLYDLRLAGLVVGVGDTQSDSIQCLNFAKKWFIQYSIQYCFQFNSKYYQIKKKIGQFLGNFPIRPVSMISWLLNWIIFWIESAEFILNWIIFWNGSLVKQYWIEYWMNRFLAKFKHWIESDGVSNTTYLQALS